MDKLALLALLEARPGMEAAVEEFLKSAQPLVLQESGTRSYTPLLSEQLLDRLTVDAQHSVKSILLSKQHQVMPNP